MKAILFAIVAVLALTGVVRAKAPDSWAFVVLGQNKAGATVAMARVAIDMAGQVCPALTGTGPLSLTAKGLPSIAMTPRVNPNPTNFPVTVCEAILPPLGAYSTGSVTLSAVSLTKTPERVVVFGDSGCKNDAKQACDKPHDWPFQEIAGVAAGEKPDLLIHVGDYNYRGTPGTIVVNGQSVHTYDAGDADDEDGAAPFPPLPYYSQTMIGSSVPDAWDAWKKDFFEPASTLLASAPWIFVRGNHELCSRAGPGFLYLLDPGSSLAGMGGQFACPSQNAVAGGPSPLVFVPPYTVTLGNLAFAMIDTVNADDTGSTYPGVYKPQMAGLVAAIAKSKTPTWVVTHRPFWGIEKGDGGVAQVINATLDLALGATPLKAFPPNVALVVSGHMHRFQAMSFSGGKGMQPNQIIVGTGGVRLGKSFPTQSGNAPFTAPVGAFTATGVGLSEFGLMRIDVGSGGAWTGKFKDRKGNTLADCGGSTPGVCTLR